METQAPPLKQLQPTLKIKHEAVLRPSQACPKAKAVNDTALHVNQAQLTLKVKTLDVILERGQTFDANLLT